ncbi:MAG TPA: glycosyltransferase [Pararobbsia sp.]|nr:glycosyltransferase [Pararobbsia sp.]
MDDEVVQFDSNRINIVYTGRLQRSRAGTRIDALLDAIDMVLSEGKGERLLFHFFGQYTREELRAFDRFVERGIVRVGGLLPRAQALAVQRRADVLLLVTAPGQASIATGKLFEYLGAGRPILALTKGTAAESIVRETEAGWTIAPDDVAGISLVLRGLSSDRAVLGTVRPDVGRIKSYERGEQMKRYAQLLRGVRTTTASSA